jgi:outer membrane protein OmpA-like peptidoglycan-associated protein
MIGAMRLGARLAGVALLAGVIGMGGCKNVSKADYDNVMNENNELRSKLADEQKARQEAESRNASLEQERIDFANAGAKNPGGPGAKGNSNLGFENGDGVSSFQRGSDVVVEVAGDVLFDSGSANLKSSAKKTLDKVASVIKSRYGSNQIRVEGYTDSDPLVKTKGKWENNERLSGERALAVEQYLSTKGITKNQIYYAGFGAARPKNSKKESRRVEIVILGTK